MPPKQAPVFNNAPGQYGAKMKHEDFTGKRMVVVDGNGGHKTVSKTPNIGTADKVHGGVFNGSKVCYH